MDFTYIVRFTEQMKIYKQSGIIPEARVREDEWLEERLERHLNPIESIEVLRKEGVCLLINQDRVPGGGMIKLTTNITARKQMEEDLRVSLVDTERAGQAKPEF